jgi:hypothetical protein
MLRARVEKFSRALHITTKELKIEADRALSHTAINARARQSELHPLMTS